MTNPIKHCPQPDPPELVRLADGYHYQSEDEMKELTDEQIYKIWYQTRGIGTVGFCGNFARAAIAAHVALNAADLAPRTYDQEDAIKEGHRNKAEDDYFNARPQVDHNMNRVYSKGGFDRGWDAAKKDAPADRDVMRQTLEGIANADQSNWDEGLRDGDAFKIWAQSRARHALAVAPTPPAEQTVTDGGRNMFFDGRFDGETEREQSARLRWADDMRAAFEKHTGNGWFDKDWRQETALWAAAWRAAKPEVPPAEQPIDLVLHCPVCGMQHVDAPEGQFYPGQTAEESVLTNKAYGLWSNPPHRSHLCHGCGHVWRPADVPTNGVQAVKTKGKNDSPPAEQPEGPARTGWPEGMLQDDSRELSKALASKPNARAEARSAAEHQVAQEPVAWLTPGGDVTRSKIFADEQSALSFGQQRPTPLYTHPSPTLTELRAKVEALQKYRWAANETWLVGLDDVLAEIDKLGGKV